MSFFVNIINGKSCAMTNKGGDPPCWSKSIDANKKGGRNSVAFVRYVRIC